MGLCCFPPAYFWGCGIAVIGPRVTVRKDVGDDVPLFVADQTLLKRVFANLIQNAVTHSAKAVELLLAARLDGDGVLGAA